LYRNKELLKSLGLDKPFFEPVEKARKTRTVSKKRKSEHTENTNGDSTAPPRKTSRIETESLTSQSEGSLRRSTRNRGKVVDYNAESISKDQAPISFKAGIRTTENTGPLGRQDGKRIHDP
jgi:E3 ubiquitin-protein ligase UHRF1